MLIFQFLNTYIPLISGVINSRGKAGNIGRNWLHSNMNNYLVLQCPTGFYGYIGCTGLSRPRGAARAYSIAREQMFLTLIRHSRSEMPPAACREARLDWTAWFQSLHCASLLSYSSYQKCHLLNELYECTTNQ